MKTFSLLAALAATTLATPLSILSTRKLTDLDNRATCPPGGVLPPTYIKPNLMVPISAKLPKIAFPATTYPTITPNDFCTIFNLEIPSSGFNKTCTLEFLFPDHSQTLSPYVYAGKGHFTFTGYAFGSGAVAGKTTYANPPPAGPNPPTPPNVLAPGNAYVINAGPCGIPEGATVTVSGALCSTDTTFKFKQSDAKCPLGFFVGLT
ncbi:hypothetical protein K402DRAFT_339964 [Aulographum hederae CBS 113979]|uniref:Ubiquitin 3 binding protein But2 C-terminal domain-containing protein n=1 Tax=Aulographum hederae CBS 113979 TaxID=1176131 RepID=A0A6G1GNW5_9PEZI|nr:hypothetical protein K402DRAFT_339964 [Aulographum hederae CBS 113979]